MSKDEILGLIEFLGKPLEFYKDPIYTEDEKEEIKRIEDILTLQTIVIPAI